MQKSGGDVELQPGHFHTHGVGFDAYKTEFSGTDASVGEIAKIMPLETSEFKLTSTMFNNLEQKYA
jgi:hypothetical protein